VVGDWLLIWRPTLRGAIAQREKLEASGWYRPLLAPLGGSRARPEGVIYGPVVSRRLGRSLGVNLTPAGGRVCSFDCVYCELAGGRVASRGAQWPTPEEVTHALADQLPRAGPLDSITISGAGEPTLHPRFAAVVETLVAEARRARPGVPVRILTNGERGFRGDVRRALDQLDERIVKLDAAAARVNRPITAAPFGMLVASLCMLRDVTLQSCFVDGAISNSDDESAPEWAGVVGKIRPRTVEIYTINRPPRAGDVRPVSAARLEEIACLLRARTGIEARVCCVREPFSPVGAFLLAASKQFVPAEAWNRARTQRES